MLNSHNDVDRPAFTIIEVLIALTASLLLMLGLTRAFKLIGDRITASQSELQLSSELRDVTFRLRDELRRLTPKYQAPLPEGKGGGYFHYYEGPWTDATTTLIHGSIPNPDVQSYYPTSRFGDLDDYIAFTTRTDPDKPFTGFVPAGVVEAFRLEKFLKRGGTLSNFRTQNGKTVGSSGSFTAEDASAQVAIFSDIAEVCYFLAPEWERSALGVPVVADPSASATPPKFLDVINHSSLGSVGDGVPDRLTLRRRILLIRPDLNMSLNRMLFLNNALGASGGAFGMSVDDPEIPYLTGSNVSPIRNVAQFNPGDWQASPISNSPNWLCGMARMQQWLDLSVSRYVDATNGIPTGRVRANTLNDLSQPENRFASVRMPVELFNANSLTPFTNDPLLLPSGALDAVTSSMPMLALSPPHELISTASGTGFIASPDPLYSVTGGQAASTAPNHNFALVGFVRPEFCLADHWYDLGSTVARATLRGGSDILALDVLAFDVQVYDPTAAIAIWTGLDGQPGVAGVNDDGDKDSGGVDIIDNTSELGFAGTDDVLVEAGTKSIRTALNFSPVVTHPSNSVSSGAFIFLPYGAYVDNGYGRLAGGVVGGDLAANRLPAALRPMFQTQFSGITPFSGSSFPVDWHKSGKFLLSSGPVPSFYQASIDTWTSNYDSDNFVQPEITWPAGGGTSSLAFTGSLAVTNTTCRYWSRATRLSSPDNRFTRADAVNVDYESSPPSASLPSAVKITIRVYDRTASEIRQQSIIEHFQQ